MVKCQRATSNGQMSNSYKYCLNFLLNLSEVRRLKYPKRVINSAISLNAHLPVLFCYKSRQPILDYIQALKHQVAGHYMLKKKTVMQDFPNKKIHAVQGTNLI